MNNKVFTALPLTVFLLTSYPSVPDVQATQTFIMVQSVWKPFSSKAGAFKVLMPGTPIQETDTVNTQAGFIPVNVFSVARQNEAVYGVAYTDYPKNITPNFRELDQLIRELTSKDLEAAGVKLINQRTLRLNNFLGREIKLQLPEGLIMKWRFYLVNKRLYQLFVMTDKEASLTKSIDGFFNSFQLVNNPVASQNPSVQNLNTNLQRSVCNQNGSQAINVVNQMIATTTNTSERSRLTNYRNQLQNLANSKTRVSPRSLSGCTTR